VIVNHRRPRVRYRPAEKARNPEAALIRHRLVLPFRRS
jgi:hypothetical protein